MTRRINARLEPDLVRKVEALCKRTGQSTTEIVKASLEAYYVAVTQKGRPADLLGELIGCAEGPQELSTTYKAELTKSIPRKNRA